VRQLGKQVPAVESEWPVQALPFAGATAFAPE